MKPKQEHLDKIKKYFYDEADIVDSIEIAASESEVPKEKSGAGVTIKFESMETTSIDLCKEASWNLRNEIKQYKGLNSDEEYITCYISIDLYNTEYNIYYLTPKKEGHKPQKIGF